MGTSPAPRSSGSITTTPARVLPQQQPNRTETFRRLTQEEWDALTPQQQTAVQFNADLYNAVTRDRASQGQYKPDQVQRDAYREAGERIFGKGGTSTKEMQYAPETMGVLAELNLSERDRLGSFDDYLDMDMAISSDELASLNELTSGPQPSRSGVRSENAERYPSRAVSSDPAANRMALAQHLTRAQGELYTRLGKTLAHGDELLAGWSERNANRRALDFGAVSNTYGLESLTEQDLSNLDSYLGALATPTQADGSEWSLDETIGMMNEDMAAMSLPPERQLMYYNALSEALRSASMGEAEWFPDRIANGETLRSPQEIIGRLGVTPVPRF